MISLRTSVKDDGREFLNYITLDVLKDGVAIGQIQSEEVSGGIMRVSTVQVERGAWIAWAGVWTSHAAEETRKMKRHPTKADAIAWIEQEAAQ